MAALSLVDPPQFAVVFAAFNTLFNVPTAAGQQACIDRVAALLAPGGLFVVEAFVPADRGSQGPASTVVPRHLGVDEVVLSASQHDEDAQTITGQHIHITEQGIRLRPWHLRYATPAGLDEMAAAAGLDLAWRHGGWDGAPFEPDASVHVSAYGRGNVRSVLPPGSE